MESSIESLHNSILGSIKEALFLSNDSTLFAPVSENQKTHVFAGILFLNHSKIMKRNPIRRHQLRKLNLQTVSNFQ